MVRVEVSYPNIKFTLFISIEAACAAHPTADVFINFASFRRFVHELSSRPKSKRCYKTLYYLSWVLIHYLYVFSSAADSSKSALKQPTIRVVAIIAEGVPESDTKESIAFAKANNKVEIDKVFP